MLFVNTEPHKKLTIVNHDAHHQVTHTTSLMSMLMESERAELDLDEDRHWFEENDLLFMNSASHGKGHIFTPEHKAELALFCFRL